MHTVTSKLASARWTLVAVLGVTLGLFGAHGPSAWAEEVLPKPQPFRGKIDASIAKSVPAWPAAPQAPAGAPNVVLILLDDVGFGAASTFGGPTATPELDRLAANGLRYNRFHVTGMCSPTRAALLTGRNHHQVGFGAVAEAASGYPGYDMTWKRETASIAEVLKQHGYSTAAFGKWHNTPGWELGPTGPFAHWPTGLGFDYFYGFFMGENSQWEPILYRNTLPVDAPATPAEGYHFTTDIVNDAIRWIHRHDAVVPGKPFFLYLAPGATHAPLQVPKEWIAPYQGKFDRGWDALREETFARQKKLGVIPADAELTPRPAEFPAWGSLSADARRLVARQMEVYAGFLAHTDHEVGRLLNEIRKAPYNDNTLIIYIVGDNGASGEGGMEGSDITYASNFGAVTDLKTQLSHMAELGSEKLDNHYATPWAWAANTPFQWVKQMAGHLGADRDPMIVSWPARIKDRGGLRTQFQHVTDVVPTILDAAGIVAPDVVNGVTQLPMAGTSFLATFGNAQAPSRHTTQYFEIFGNRGIYKDGWWAGTIHTLPWSRKPVAPTLDEDRWELYHLDVDYSQAHDLAAREPQKLAALQAEFDKEARRNQVYPLLPTPYAGVPSPATGRTAFQFAGDVTRVPQSVLPELTRSHRITADLTVPAKPTQGVIIAEGGRFGGFSLYVKDGRLVYENNTFGQFHTALTSAQPLPPGQVQVVFDFVADAAPSSPMVSAASGLGRLSVNGKPVAEGRFEHYGVFQSSIYEPLDIGRDSASPVSAAYESPYAFTGTIEQVRIDLQ
ncbi:MAG: arylsulfatase [Candidatus Binatia bacterium]